ALLVQGVRSPNGITHAMAYLEKLHPLGPPSRAPVDGPQSRQDRRLPEEARHRGRRSAMKNHQYQTHMVWTGNTGEGTATYRSYKRNFTLTAPGKPELLGSSDHAFRGDADRYNPED